MTLRGGDKKSLLKVQSDVQVLFHRIKLCRARVRSIGGMLERGL